MKILDWEFPEDRFYDREHVWFKKEGDLYRVGITDFFQKMANEIVFVELPTAGRSLEAGKPFVSVESGKWVGRVKSAINGAVAEGNKELADFPYLLNESPYDEGWLIMMKPSDQDVPAGCFSLDDPEGRKGYEDFLEAEKQRIASMSK